MKFSNISSFGRQVLRSVLLVSGVVLGARAIGCGGAATKATIDESVPAADPADLGVDAESELGTAAPEATETPAE